MYKGKSIGVIIAAAGKGSRMKSNIPKQYLKINNEHILTKVTKQFYNNKNIDALYVVVGKGEVPFATKILSQNMEKIKMIKEGGKERQDSIGEVLEEVTEDYILIHDGARPFVTDDIIQNVIKEAIKKGAAICGVTPKDTIRKKEKTLKRKELYSVQTPQGFENSIIKKAYRKAKEDGIVGTDDASLVEGLCSDIGIVEGSYENIKITTREDLPLESKVGIGYDVHQLVTGRSLILGGVNIPHEKGLQGHSDADVLTHAIMDALLGAAALGDIGKFFPDTDDEFKDVSSLKLLEEVAKILLEEEYSIGNIDGTIIAQNPKISPFVDHMRENISKVLKIDKSKINIKGTTTEKLGFVGREEGIAAEAVCIINR